MEININKNMMMWAVIGVLFLAVLFLTFKASSVDITGNSASTGKIDMTGWTENEIMNYEMHGTIPSRAGKASTSSSSAPSSNSMIGSC